jgi:hypothetical protein
MKLPLFCCALLTLASATFGQDSPGTPPPLPSGPLLKRAPDLSTWTVTSQNGAPPKQGQNQNSGGDNQQAPQGFRQAVVTKTGKIIDEQLVDALGRKFELWHVNGMLLTGGESAPVIVPDSAGKDIYTTNFALSDFAGLDWISPRTYAGIQKVMGRDCIIFRGEVNSQPAAVQSETKLAGDRANLVAARAAYYASNISGSGGGQSTSSTALKGNLSAEVSAVACIDLETRLPVAVTFGQETRTYVFGQPPTSPLELPPAFATALGAYQKHITNLSRAAAAP